MSDKAVKTSQSRTTRVGCAVGCCGQWESALKGLALRCWSSLSSLSVVSWD